MSLELRWRKDGRVECDWGIVNIDGRHPWHKQSEVKPLIFAPIAALVQIEAKPDVFESTWEGERVTVRKSVARHDDRIFFHVDTDGLSRTTYELFAARWTDSDEIVGYVGRWPD